MGARFILGSSLGSEFPVKGRKKKGNRDLGGLLPISRNFVRKREVARGKGGRVKKTRGGKFDLWSENRELRVLDYSLKGHRVAQPFLEEGSSEGDSMTNAGRGLPSPLLI